MLKMAWKVQVCPKRMRSPGRNGEGELRGQPANPGSPGKMAVKTECVCVYGRECTGTLTNVKKKSVLTIHKYNSNKPFTVDIRQELLNMNFNLKKEFDSHLSEERIHSVLQHCWLGDRKGIWPVKNLAPAIPKGSFGDLRGPNLSDLWEKPG